jgi:hypothetical protein
LREAVGDLTEEQADVDTDRLAEVMADSGAQAANVALRSLASELEQVRQRLGL